MEISKLLNPLVAKRPRLDNHTLHQQQTSIGALLPVELVAHFMLYFEAWDRRPLSLVCKRWFNSYNLFHRNSFFAPAAHVRHKNVTKRSLLRSFTRYGHRARYMLITSEILVAMLQLEPSFANLIPNVQHLYIPLDQPIPSEQLFNGFVNKLLELRKLYMYDQGFAPDEHFSAELDKAIANKPFLRIIQLDDIELNSHHFPGPITKAMASQFIQLELPVSGFEAADTMQAFAPFVNLRTLGLIAITTIDVMHAAVEVLTDPKNFPHLDYLLFITDLDIMRTAPLNTATNGVVTAVSLIERVCGINRNRFRLYLGMNLGACSGSDMELIESEREFVVNLGKKHADILYGLKLMHRQPLGDYDPLTTFLYDAAPRYPMLAHLRLFASPTSKTKGRLVDALNNEFLLPNLQSVLVQVDGSQDAEWIEGYSPVSPSRGMYFEVVDVPQHDLIREANENGTAVRSIFAPDWDGKS